MSAKNKAGKNNDVMVKIEQRSLPIQDADKLFQGKAQGQIAAIHVLPAIQGGAMRVQCTYTPDATFKVAQKENHTIQNGEEDITIRGYFRHGGMMVLTGNAKLAKLVDQPTALDALAKAFQKIQDRHGKPVSRLWLSGKNECTLVNLGNRWINLTPTGKTQVRQHDLVPKAAATYGFRTDAEGHLVEIVKLDLGQLADILDISRWNVAATLPAGTKKGVWFKDASRFIVDADGAIRFQAWFTDGTCRDGKIRLDGKVDWSEPYVAEGFALTRAWFDNKNLGIVEMNNVPGGTELVFYPSAQIPVAHRAYAQIS